MYSSPPSDKLTPLQRRVLRAFFERERGFFLSETDAPSQNYLALVVLDDGAFERGRHVLADFASRVDTRIDVTRREPGFQRAVLTCESDGLVVDLTLRSP